MAFAQVNQVPAHFIEQQVELQPVANNMPHQLGMHRLAEFNAVADIERRTVGRPAALHISVTHIIDEPDTRLLTADLDIEQAVFPQPQRIMTQFLFEQRPAIEPSPHGHGNSVVERCNKEIQPLHVRRAHFALGRFVGLANTFVIAAYDIVPAVFPDGRHQFLQHAGIPDVVAVEKTDVVALRMPDTRLTGPGSPLVYSTYDDDARVALRVAACHGLRTVRRPVIDDDSLEIPVRLPSDRIEAGIEIVFQIVNRNNDRYHGL